jgi:hypothetical protein
MHLSQTLVHLNTPVDPVTKLALGNEKRYVVTVVISDNSGMVPLKKVVEKLGIPQFIQFHERLLFSNILYIFSSIPW